MSINNLIFFIFPNHEGSEKNQFPPFRDGAEKLIFKNYLYAYADR